MATALGRFQAGDQPKKPTGSQRHRNVYSHQDQHDQGDMPTRAKMIPPSI